ncbi:Uncharacterized protein FWK35_00014455, partial [Aphis craccivora]
MELDTVIPTMAKTIIKFRGKKRKNIKKKVEVHRRSVYFAPHRNLYSLATEGSKKPLNSVQNNTVPLRNIPDSTLGVRQYGTFPTTRVALNLNKFFIFQLTKYCPFCQFNTDNNKMVRHIGIKHSNKIRKPLNATLATIGKIYGSESRRSITLVPMSVVRHQVGSYWHDVSYRRIAFRLCIMGRMKVYGGSWDLPEAPDISNPFQKYIVDDPPQSPRPATPTSPVVTSAVCQTPTSVQSKHELAADASKASKKIRKDLQEEGLQMQLPSNHPLLQMHLTSLMLSHPKHSPAVNNYMTNMSRILCYVDKHLRNQKKPANHWSDLLGCGVEPFVDYLEKREKLVQTVSTSINYLKNLGNLVDMSISTYSYDDPKFPRSFDGEPRLSTINCIKVLKKKHDLLYKSKLKKQPAELFLWNIDETNTLTEYGAVKSV